MSTDKYQTIAYAYRTEDGQFAHIYQDKYDGCEEVGVFEMDTPEFWYKLDDIKEHLDFVQKYLKKKVTIVTFQIKEQ